MPTTLKTLTKDIGLLTIALTFALMANFAYSAWSNPTQTPTGGNTDAPINVGSVSQVKTGGLSTGALSVVGHQGITGEIRISSIQPTIKYFNTDAMDFWTRANNNSFYIFADRNDDGAWSGDGNAALTLTSGTATDGSGDYATFSNQVRANQYCDRSGNGCVDITTVGSAPAVEAVENIEIPRFEMGRVDLIHPTTQSGTSYRDVTFSSRFNSTPQVEVAVASAQFQNNCKNDQGTFEVRVTNITNNGFRIQSPYFELSGGNCSGSIVNSVTWFAANDGSRVVNNSYTNTQIKNALYAAYPSLTRADDIFAGPSERIALCQLLLPGSIVFSHTTDQWTSPGNNSANYISGGSTNGGWNFSASATSYNSRLMSLTCRR